MAFATWSSLEELSDSPPFLSRPSTAQRYISVQVNMGNLHKCIVQSASLTAGNLWLFTQSDSCSNTRLGIVIIYSKKKKKLFDHQ